MAKNVKRRLAWIEASLRYAGQFGAEEKAAYRDIFGVSEPSVSRDQATFDHVFCHEIGRDVLNRDEHGRPLGGKLTLREGTSLPIAAILPGAPSLEEWLSGIMKAQHFQEYEIDRSEPDLRVMRQLIRAIRDQSVLRMTYHSRRSRSERVVSPHRIIKVAGRLHIRGWDHTKHNEPADFAISRISHAKLITAGSPTYIDATKDKAWHEDVTIRIRVQEGLPSEAIEGIGLDFGLNDQGFRDVVVPKPLAGYLIDDTPEGYKSPVQKFVKK